MRNSPLIIRIITTANTDTPGKTVVKAHLLLSGIAPEYVVIDGNVELVVSNILDHEVIALDLDDKQKR